MGSLGQSLDTWGLVMDVVASTANNVHRRASAARRSSIAIVKGVPLVNVETLQIRKEWRELFYSVDHDRSGTITLMELYRFILKVAKDEDDDNIVNMADVKTIFKDLDNDGDGNVELDEFLTTVMSQMDDEKWAALLENSLTRKEEQKMSEDEIERIFKEIDKDESGSITKKEAVRACRRNSTMAGLEDVEAWLDASDKNGDGSLSLEEFKFAFVGTNMINL